ncbi:hypothetical protein [Aureibacillus halotolerans]|uniref:Uncharacterized protein n=1 Tax=Aureibacillus halotolerans TaxID=1508390 RepID=A0A4R6TZI4_9BACI|nr:hypothetical protein [Aureibacillus halotolerans]TDQ37405.1 hypothetical protein EV213_11339 [Aureibacillus halotolerans]
METNVQLKWLQSSSKVTTGVTWGVPWKEGVVPKGTSFSLEGAAGDEQHVQTWPLAYWPDGSIKWSAHAATLSDQSESFTLRKTTASTVHTELKIEDNDAEIIVHTGVIVCRFAKSGSSVLSTIERDGVIRATDAQLICLLEKESRTSGELVTTEKRCESEIDSAVVEQAGPIRATICVKGRHRFANSKTAWLPFTLRFYLYAGDAQLKLVHSFEFDGQAEGDFIKGLGLRFRMPFSGPLYNRHIRFTGDTGCFSEASKNLRVARMNEAHHKLHLEQIEGKCLQLNDEKESSFLELLDDAATWDSFKLVQDSADHYTISKRTKPVCSWLKATEGHRSKGLMFIGSEGGGIAICERNFWQKHPTAVEVEGMASDTAQATLWFWSPDAPRMDLRHYDTETHLHAAYEGFEEMRATPYGIANTNECTLFIENHTPSQQQLLAYADTIQQPPILVCEPAYYHEVQAFGYWSLPDRSTEVGHYLEQQLDEMVAFYMKEIEQRRWYGFWDYGDVMHTYDGDRHVWQYDVGGYAWQNTELVPNLWLWYSYLRSGRADLFRLAEAMTRHTSEVDMYHRGEYSGLGSRHNVSHWGCGCKEARISMAGLHRFYYYLTADERIGDIMDEVKAADYTTEALDPMRAYHPKGEFPTHARVGPDWSAFVSNWMTRWERYEEDIYLDKIMVGIKDLVTMPYQMKTLSTYGYDPKSGHLYDMGDFAGSHLAICMGAPQVWTELSLLLKDHTWEQMLIDIGAFYHLTPEDKKAFTSPELPTSGYHWPVFGTGMAAFAAWKKADVRLAEKVWTILLETTPGEVKFQDQLQRVPENETIRPIEEVPWISTNSISQWSLNVIFSLTFIREHLPEKLSHKHERGTVS